jgi:hypothetical protein
VRYQPGFPQVVALAALIVFPTPVLHGLRILAPSADRRDSHIPDVDPTLDPQPPCNQDPTPPYPPLDQPAVVKSWSRTDPALKRDWIPPACTGWFASGFSTMVTIGARFRYAAGAQGLLQRFGAISELTGVRYWSTTHKQWRTLIVDAYALSASQAEQRRKDFAPGEMKQGTILYFEQIDNLSGKGIYRMSIVKASEDRLVVEVENVTTLRYLLVPVLHPGEIQSIYFLDRESDNVWRFYAMVRTGRGANHLIARNESSAVNRAAALYRHLVGLPTDQEPPAAP